MYIRRKVFSCVEERSFAEEQRDGKKKWSPVDEDFVRTSKKYDEAIGRDRKLAGALMGFGVGMTPAYLVSDLSSNAKVRKAGEIALIPSAAVGSYLGYKALGKWHDKKSSSKLRADLERYEQLSPRDRKAFREMKDRERLIEMCGERGGRLLH